MACEIEKAVGKINSLLINYGNNKTIKDSANDLKKVKSMLEKAKILMIAEKDSNTFSIESVSINSTDDEIINNIFNKDIYLEIEKMFQSNNKIKIGNKLQSLINAYEINNNDSDAEMNRKDEIKDLIKKHFAKNKINLNNTLKITLKQIKDAFSIKEKNNTPSELNDDQKIVFNDAIDFFVNSTDQVYAVDAAGGTGKTFTVGKVYEHIKNKYGIYLSYYAPTHAAKEVLSENTGIAASTVAAGLALIPKPGNPDIFIPNPDPKAIKGISKGNYIVVDEASMITESILKMLKNAVGPKGKILFMGDRAQLPPIRSTEDFGMKNKNSDVSPALTGDNIGTLTKVMRFDEKSSIGKITSKLREDSLRDKPVGVARSLDGVELSGNVSVMKNKDDIVDSFINDSKTNPKGTVLITFNNEKNTYYDDSVLMLNKKIRSRIEPDNLKTYVDGDILVTYATTTDEITEVTIGNSKRIELTNVSKPFLKEYNVKDDKKRSHHFSFETQTATLTTGEKVNILTQNAIEEIESKKQSILANNASLERAGRKKEWGDFFNLDLVFRANALNTRFGYAITSHKAQGQSYDSVYVMLDNLNRSPEASRAQAIYVAMSRAKKKLVVHSSILKSSAAIDTISNSINNKESIKVNKQIKKEKDKLAKFIKDNVEFSVEYNKDMAYKFVSDSFDNVGGTYDSDKNVVSLPDFNELIKDEEMMKTLYAESYNKYSDMEEYKDITKDEAKNIVDNNIDQFINDTNNDAKLHEFIHASLVRYMSTKAGSNTKASIDRMYKVIQALAKREPDRFNMNNKYWDKNIDEFIAEALSNQELISELKKIDINGKPTTGSKKSMIQSIIDSILVSLKLKDDDSVQSMHKYLKDILENAVLNKEVSKDGLDSIDIGIKEDIKIMSLNELYKKLHEIKYNSDNIKKLIKEQNDLLNKENITEKEDERLYEIESILDYGIENKETIMIENEIKNRIESVRNSYSNLNKNIDKIYNSLEEKIKKIGHVPVNILSDKDEIIKILNKHNKSLSVGGFFRPYGFGQTEIMIIDTNNLSDDDIDYVNKNLNNKIKLIDSDYDKIKNRNIQHNIIHEKIHFATALFMKDNPSSEHVENINRLFEIAKKSGEMNNTDNEYWKTDVFEFISEAMSNPSVMSGLINIKSEKNNIFSELVKTISKIIGIKTDNNIYFELIETFENIVNEETNLSKNINYDSILNIDKKYKTIKEDDIMLAKDIMTKNKKDCS